MALTVAPGHASTCLRWAVLHSMSSGCQLLMIPQDENSVKRHFRHRFAIEERGLGSALAACAQARETYGFGPVLKCVLDCPEFSERWSGFSDTDDQTCWLANVHTSVSLYTSPIACVAVWLDALA